MSEAKNFRIGNLILLNGDIITVSGIDQYGINPEVNRGVESYDYYFDNTDNDKLEGIPITEEILIKKLGFEKISPKHYIHPETMLFELFNKTALDDGFKITGGRMAGNFFLATTKELKYIHDIQDAFSVTGKELTITQEING